MTELFINGQYIELSNQELLPSSQVADIFSVESIHSGITKRFAIPKTPANKKALEGADNINTLSLVPYRHNEAKVLIDGVEVFFNSIAIIEDSGSVFNCIIKYGNADFFSLLTRKLAEIDFSELEHNWSLAEFAASQDNTHSDGYTWALIDFGLQQNQQRFSVRHSLPSVFVRYLIEKIAVSKGYSLGGSIWTSAEFSADIIPLATRWISDGIMNKAKVTAWQNSVQSFPAGSTGGTLARLNFTDEVGDQYNLWNGNTYTASVDSTIRISLNVYYNSVALGAVPPTNQLSIRKILNDGSEVVLSAVNQGAYSGNPTIIADYEVLAGEKISVWFESLASAGNIIEVGNPNYSTVIISIQDAQQTVYGMGYPIGENLPDMTEKDLFKAVAMRYGIIYKVDNLTRTLYAERMQDIAEKVSTADSYDWTALIDLKAERNDIERININYRANVAKRNWFRFAEDESVKKYYGDAVFTIDDSNLVESGDYVEFPFAASQIINRLSFPMPEIKRYSDYLGNDNDVKNRYLQNYKTSGTLQLKGHTQITLLLTSGSSGFLVITLLGATPAMTIPFNTSIGQTIEDWISEYSDALLELGISCTKSGNQIIFRTLAFGKNFNAISLWGSSITGSTTDQSENSTHTGSISLASFISGASILSDNYAGNQRMLNYFKKLKVKIFLSVYDFVNFDHFKPVFIRDLGWFYIQSINGFRSNATTEVEMIALDNWITEGSVDFIAERSIDSFEVEFTGITENAESYKWDFGDGSISTAQNPTHTYASCGVYSVTLTITDSSGRQNKMTQSVSVPKNSLRFNYKCNSQYVSSII